MTEAVVDDIVAVLPPLLNALEALGFFQRHLHPPAFASVMNAIGSPDEALQAARAAIGDWPEQFAGLRERLDRACNETLAAFAGIREVERGNGDLVAVFRALRHLPRAQEALYPLAVQFPPVSSFFLNAANRGNAELLSRLEGGASENTGIFHDHNEPGSRGGFSVYVPEYYTPDRTMPLVMALHGGSGNGRGFLWSWLRDARSLGAILVAPTAIGPTWALMGDDADTPNLMRILETVRSRWSIDVSRMLLTGMSDGGTFCYVTGARRCFALHPSCAGVGDLPSADGGGGERQAPPAPAGLHHPRQARLDVSGADRTADAGDALYRRRRRDLSGDRRPQSHLSARDQRGAAGLAE